MPQFTLVYGGDWEGLYKDGVLVTEGHSVSLEDFAFAADLDVRQLEADSGWLEDRGCLPKDLAEVKAAARE